MSGLLESIETTIQLNNAQKELAASIQEFYSNPESLRSFRSSKETSPLEDDFKTEPQAELKNENEKISEAKGTIDPGNIPLENPQQFLKWFTGIEHQMENEQMEEYRLTVSRLHKEKDFYKKKIERCQDMLKALNDIKNKYSTVESKTKSLQEECEKLLEEQVKLGSLAEAIDEKLNYFDDFERISKFLNTYGDDVCLQDNFVPTLCRLDDCLKFVSRHHRYKDSELYLMRFKQCMSRSLSLIKSYFCNVIKGLSTELSLKVSKDQDVTKNSSTILYIPFKAISSGQKLLMSELEIRCEDNSEYVPLLKDCYYAFFSARKKLLFPIVEARVNEIAASSPDILSLSKAGLSYLVQVCSDEFNLFFDFFDSGDEDVSVYLMDLITIIDDYLRPLVIKENSIDILVDLCSLIRQLSVDKSEDDDESPLSKVLDKILQDAQARIVFRSQSFIHSYIELYKPSAEDYNLTDSKTQESPEVSLPVSDSPKSIPGWFPTLTNTIYIISKLYLSVNQSVFDDLSHDALEFCVESLKSAKSVIQQKSGFYESNLFFIKQLSTLIRQLEPFQTDFIQMDKSLDFSNVVDAINDVQKDYGIFQLVQNSIPKLVEKQVETRKEIEDLLWSSIDKLVQEVSKSTTEPINNFMIKERRRASAFRIQKSSSSNIRETLANERNISEVNESYKECVKNRYLIFKTKATQYLGEEATEILKRIEDSITDTVDEYITFLKEVQVSKNIEEIKSLLVK